MLNTDRSYLWPGVPLALASAVLFGVSTPLSKLLLGEVAPQLLAGLLYLGAGAGLVIVHAGGAIIGLPATEAPLCRSDMPWLAAIILFGGVLGPLLLMLGLARTHAASAALLLNLEGLATMSIAWLAFREYVDRRLLLGAMAILSGAVVLSWEGRGVVLDRGALLVAAACVAWGIDNNLTRNLSSADPVLIAMTKGLVAGSVNVALDHLRGAVWPSLAAVSGAAAVGFLGIGVSLVLFVLALRHLGTARTGAYFSFAPFIGALVAMVLFHEPLTIKLVLAGALMAFGLWMHLSERHEHEHEHETLEHEHSHFHDDHHQHKHDGPITEPHSHWHRHEPLRHSHPHYPDLHHRHLHVEGVGMLSIDAIVGSRKRSGWIAFVATLLTISFGAILVTLAPDFRARVETKPRPIEPTERATGVVVHPPAVAPPSLKEAESKAIKQEELKEALREASKTTAASERRKESLPNGVQLSIPRAGVEARLLAFLENGTKRETKIAWFDVEDVTFDVGKMRPRPSSREQLRNVAKILLAYPTVTAIIGGHSDNRGAKIANRRLSKARAEWTRRELTRLGVDTSRLTVESFGGDHPAVSDDTEEGRAKNRRVSLGLIRR